MATIDDLEYAYVAAYLGITNTQGMTIQDLRSQMAANPGISATTANATYVARVGAHATVVGGTTALGDAAAASDTSGTATAIGRHALQANTTGNYNTASGVNALQANTTGNYSTASGVNALQANTTGYNNTASGVSALYANTTGYYNTASGFQAGYTANGANATTTATGQTLIGYNTGQSSAVQQNYATALGYQALIGAPGAIAIGCDSTGQGAVSNTQDLAVIGTALTTTQMAKVIMSSQPAFVAGDKYLVIAASGAVHVSATGPAS